MEEELGFQVIRDPTPTRQLGRVEASEPPKLRVALGG